MPGPKRKFITIAFSLVGLLASQAKGADLEINPNDPLSSAQVLQPRKPIQSALSSPSDSNFFILYVERESLVTVSFKTLPPPEPNGTSLPGQEAHGVLEGSRGQESTQPPQTQESPLAAKGPEPQEIGMEQAINGLVGVFFGNTSGFPWRWNVRLFSAQNPAAVSDSVDFSFGARIDTQAPQQRTVGLKPGMYVISIGPATDLPFIRNRLWSQDPYEVLVWMEPASPYSHDIEPNNTQTSAQRISLGKTIEGNLLGSQDKDIFKFRIEQAAYTELTFQHEALASYDCTWLVELFRLQDKDQEPIESLCSPGLAGAMTRTMLMEPGEYLLAISAPSALSYSSRAYSFSLAPKEF